MSRHHSGSSSHDSRHSSSRDRDRPPSSSSRHSNETDWICTDTKCGNLNYGRRTHCNKCGLKQSEELKNRRLLGTEIGKAAAEKSHGLFSAEDWQCNKCGNVNWARRATCNVCNAPKVGELEERTGLGGGFNERQGVEYRERREDSDEEWDEFGRRKKKFRATKAPSPPKPRPEEEEEEEDDDSDDGDLSKYALLSDDEEIAAEVKGGSKTNGGGGGRRSRSRSRSRDRYRRSESYGRRSREDRSTSSRRSRSRSPRRDRDDRRDREDRRYRDRSPHRSRY